MPSISNYSPKDTFNLSIKNFDVGSLSADDVACQTLTINGETLPVTISNSTSSKPDTSFSGSVQVVNRDLTLCDSSGDGLPGTVPNSGYDYFKVWGYSDFYSQLNIVRKQNPGDIWNYLGPSLQITNPQSKPWFRADGRFMPSYTTTQFGRDFVDGISSSMQQFISYGRGNYKNRLVTDANSLMASPFSSFCIRMPTTSLDVDANGVVPVGGVKVISNVLVVVINSNGNTGPIPSVGQTITVDAVPTSLNVTNAIINSVVAGTGGTTTVYAGAPATPNATSTAVNSVYFGPRLVADGSNVASLIFNNGPIPEVGQSVNVVAQPSPFSTSYLGKPIVTVSIGTTYTTVTYLMDTPVASGDATSITSVSLLMGDPYTDANPLGIMANIGIHNSNPESPLDVIGNVTFRDRASKRKLFQTLTNGVNQSSVCVYNTSSSTNNLFAEFDAYNNKFNLYNTSTGSGTICSLDAANQSQTYYNNSGTAIVKMDMANSQFYVNGLGGNNFFIVDSNLARVGIGVGTTPTAGFQVNTGASFTNGIVRITSNAGGPYQDLYLGMSGTQNLIRTSVSTNCVGINKTTPTSTLDVGGTLAVSGNTTVGGTLQVGTKYATTTGSSGIQIRYGTSGNLTGTTTGTITFGYTFTSAPVVTISIQMSSPVKVGVANITTTGFTYYFDVAPGGSTLSWIAIGPGS